MESSNQQHLLVNDPDIIKAKKFLDASREASYRFWHFAGHLKKYDFMDEPAIILRAVENMRAIVSFVDQKWPKRMQNSLKSSWTYRGYELTDETRAEVAKRAELVDLPVH